MKVRVLDFLRRELWGNPAHAWLTALAGALTVLCLVLALRRVVLRRSNAHPLLVDLLRGIRAPFVLMGALWLGSLALELPLRAAQVARTGALIAMLAQGSVWIRGLIAQALGAYRRKKTEEDPGAATALGLIQFLANAALWIVVTLVILDNLGVNITGFVAGLGIGGIAVAMAAQTVLADLFASLSIVLDKPFRVGDFIIVGDAMGLVERIGLKSTLVRSPSGEGLIFSNGDLLRGRIRNFGRLRERRVEFVVGAALGTPIEKVELIPSLLREAVEAQPRARFERAHLKEVGTCLSFEGVYHVRDASYEVYMDVQEAVTLAVVRRFHEEQIEFAPPPKTLYVAQGVAPVRW
jgi:small-conductance mechanosensitive channel